MSFGLHWISRAIATLILAVIATTALAADRVALVIGNNDYEHAPKLQNAINDARGIAGVLRGAGFDVVEAYDQDARGIEDALDTFAGRVDGARIGMVYFAGHGIQHDGTSYLVPIDVDLTDERDLRKTISAEYFLQDSSVASDLGVVILDACRDNPFVKQIAESIGATRTVSLGRGLSRVGSVPKKTLIGFATQAGDVALDNVDASGGGSHSPYASALMKHLTTPDKDIRLVMGAVRDEVLQLTDGKQEPFTYGSLGADEIHLVPGGVADDGKPKVEGDRIAALDIPEASNVVAIPADYLAWKASFGNDDWSALETASAQNDGAYFAMVMRAFDLQRTAGLSPRDAYTEAGDTVVPVRQQSRGDVAAIQRALRDLNFYSDAIDGVAGPRTRGAIEQFAVLESGEAEITLATLIKLGELAATRQPTSEFTGTWQGRYEYPDDREGVDFSMNLIFSQGLISGSVIEPATFGDGSSKNLYANFTGSVTAEQIRWVKKYDGTGGVDHEVTYEGTLDRAQRIISGRWIIREDWSGSFEIALDDAG